MNKRVIIAGSRTFDNFEVLVERCDYFLRNLGEVTIVSGTARGADKLGEMYAEMREFPIKRFPADWDKYGKKAGHIRNEQMAQFAEYLILFWDGKSKGSANMLMNAKKYNLKIKQVVYE